MTGFYSFNTYVPSTAGTYYLWAQAYNGTSVVATNVVSTFTITVT
jgi:hypothetical protein